MTGLDRSAHSVLVTEAHTVGSIAVIRSLGMAGYKVLACSPQADALGFRSRYSQANLVCPEYTAGNEFRNWLDAAIETHRVECIIPSEGFLLAVRPFFSRIRHLLPLGRTEADVYRGMSKFDLFDAFSEPGSDPDLQANLPPYRMLDEDAILDANVAQLPFPVYVKTDGAYARHGASGDVTVARTSPELREICERETAQFSRLLLQGHVDGVGVGVFLLRWNGKIYARFMHRRLHEVPYTGGVSSLRESFWHEEIATDAIRRLESMDWHGVGMLEYRYDESDDSFALIEFNGRFWGSLHLALYAGVDFPTLLVDAFNGEPRPGARAATGLRCRLTFPKEVQYVISVVKSSQTGIARKLAVIVEFLLLGIDPRVRSDMLYGGDRGLYLPMLMRSMRDLFR